MPVPVNVLGAHLQAYADLQPTINTLRLYNRFGKGNHAAVSKPPIELVNAIEDHIVEDTRRELREEWEASFMCWEGRCAPADHYTPEECFHSYRGYMRKRDGFDEEDWNDFDNFDYKDFRRWRARMGMGVLVDEDEEIDEYLRHLKSEAKAREEEEDEEDMFTELTAEQVKDLNSKMWDDDSKDDFGEPFWHYKHDQRKDEWEVKTGERKTSSRGMFSKHAGLFKAHFGLEIHTCHTYVYSKSSEFSDRWGDEEFAHYYQATFAYLILPGSTTIEKELHRCVEIGQAMAMTAMNRLIPQRRVELQCHLQFHIVFPRMIWLASHVLSRP